MGRGRQKAKQTKVARELKYYSPNTDYSALQSELRKEDAHPVPSTPEPEGQGADDSEDDEYAEKYGRYGG